MAFKRPSAAMNAVAKQKNDRVCSLGSNVAREAALPMRRGQQRWRPCSRPRETRRIGDRKSGTTLRWSGFTSCCRPVRSLSLCKPRLRDSL